MNFKSVILVLTVVSQLCTDVYSDDGFLDDFFGRFPHLPFQTLYTVHKNQIRPGTWSIITVQFKTVKCICGDPKMGHPKSTHMKPVGLDLF